MAHAITLIPGDGTGPELAGVARRVLAATGAELSWDEPAAGDPEAAVASVRRTGVALAGPASPEAVARLCAALDVYAGVHPCKAFEGARTRFPETDMVLVREHGGGEGPGLAAPERVLRAAFAYASEHGRGRVTVAHDDDAPAQTARDVAAEHDGIELETQAVAALCGGLVSHPEHYEVVVVPARHGHVVAGLGAGMIGGAGLAPAVSHGPDAAVFGPAHGPAARHAGQDRVNPTALLLSAALMLRHLGDTGAAERLASAIAGVIRRGETVTFDLKPTPNDPSAVGTSEFADAVIQEMNT